MSDKTEKRDVPTLRHVKVCRRCGKKKYTTPGCCAYERVEKRDPCGRCGHEGLVCPLCNVGVTRCEHFRMPPMPCPDCKCECKRCGGAGKIVNPKWRAFTTTTEPNRVPCPDCKGRRVTVIDHGGLDGKPLKVRTEPQRDVPTTAQVRHVLDVQIDAEARRLAKPRRDTLCYCGHTHCEDDPMTLVLHGAAPQRDGAAHDALAHYRDMYDKLKERMDDAAADLEKIEAALNVAFNYHLAGKVALVIEELKR